MAIEDGPYLARNLVLNAFTETFTGQFLHTTLLNSYRQ